MKTILMLLAVLLALYSPPMANTAHAVTTLEFEVVADVNVPSMSQSNLMGGAFTSATYAPAGSWYRTIFGGIITAGNDGAVPLTQLTALSVTFSSTTSLTPHTINLGGLTFNAIGSAPGVRAYDMSGNDITVAAGLSGQSVLINLTDKGVYKIGLSDLRIQLDPAPTFGGDLTINNPGDVLTGTFSSTMSYGEGQTTSDSGFATTTIVPEPSSTLLLGLLGLVGFRRKRA